jgi:DsbE subfamily thiol:disulfide oxidoreductase
MRKLLVAVVVVAAVGGAYALLVSRSDDGAAAAGGPVAMNTPLPALKGESVSGGSVDLADFRGDVTVVNVWATWCGPCRAEQPALVRVSRRYADRGVRFVGLNYQDNRAAAQAWIDEFHVPYDSLVDEQGRYADDLGFPYLPDTYVVDADGTIRWAIYGETNERELSGLLDEVLARQAV